MSLDSGFSESFKTMQSNVMSSGPQPKRLKDHFVNFVSRIVPVADLVSLIMIPYKFI